MRNHNNNQLIDGLEREIKQEKSMSALRRLALMTLRELKQVREFVNTPDETNRFNH